MKIFSIKITVSFIGIYLILISVILLLFNYIQPMLIYISKFKYIPINIQIYRSVPSISAWNQDTPNFMVSFIGLSFTAECKKLFPSEN